jgi:hypothetical protein
MQTKSCMHKLITHRSRSKVHTLTYKSTHTHHSQVMYTSAHTHHSQMHTEAQNTLQKMSPQVEGPYDTEVSDALLRWVPPTVTAIHGRKAGMGNLAAPSCPPEPLVMVAGGIGVSVG